MTITVKVTAHCAADTEVQFGITTTEHAFDNPIEVVTLQDGESAEKLVYDNRIAIVQERKKVVT
jgi:hypothetical protein